VAAPPRHYDVYELAVGSDRQVTMIHDALWKNEPTIFQKLPPRFVDRIEFAGGSAQLTTAATTIRSDWLAAQPAKVVAYAAVAELGQGEGAVLARSRLSALEQTLSPVATFDPNALAETVPTVPPQLVRPGADGAILIVTKPAPVTTTCMLVVRVEHNLAANLRPQLQQDDAVVVKLIEEALNPPQTVDFRPPVSIGTAIFDVGSAQVTADSAQALQQEWTKAGTQKPDPALVFVFSRENDASAEPSLLGPRLEQVFQALGGTTPKPMIRTVKLALPGGCPAVAVLFATG
jgi:hypothetical protein